MGASSRKPRAGIRPTFRIYADDPTAAETLRWLAAYWANWKAPANRIAAALSAARRMERWALGQGVKSRRPPPR